MTQTPTERWYVVQTHARAEAKALYNLTRQGFDAYMPQYLRRRRHARRTDWVPAPLFPRYLFVRMDTGRTQWRPIRSTFGVTDLVCNGNKPAPVPDGIVEAIRRRQNENGYVVVKPASSFKKGEAVQIVSGALADHTGLFECATDEERVVLLLELLGRKVRVQVPLEDISAFG